MSKTKLEINFDNDLKQLLLGQLKKGGYLYNTKLGVKEIVRQYFNVIIREISMQPRIVHISKELLSHMPTGDLKLTFDKIVEIATTGGLLNQYLSMELLKPSYKDPLLYDWRIHHLHLGISPDKGDPRFIARTDKLLYVRVESDDFYCIDILGHDPVDGFANKQLVEIIHRNWPQLLDCQRFPKHMRSTVNPSNQNIDQLRMAGICSIISVSDGTSYGPYRGGYTTNGSSIWVTQNADMLLNRIRVLEDAIKNDETNLRNQIVKEIGRCPRTIKIKLQSWEEAGVNALEKKTNTQLHFPWVS